MPAGASQRTLTGERGEKILGIPEPWFWAIGYSAF